MVFAQSVQRARAMFDWIESLPLVPAIIFLMVVVYLRAGGTYLLGRFAHKLANRGRVQEIIESGRINNAITQVNKWGAPIVAASFLTVGFQTAANLAAGVSAMPLSRYLPALAIGGFLWAVIYATIGLTAFYLWWQVALSNPVIAGLLIFAILALIAGVILKRRLTRK